MKTMLPSDIKKTLKSNISYKVVITNNEILRTLEQLDLCKYNNTMHDEAEDKEVLKWLKIGWKA
jgi:hypothetical protein